MDLLKLRRFPLSNDRLIRGKCTPASFVSFPLYSFVLVTMLISCTSCLPSFNRLTTFGTDPRSNLELFVLDRFTTSFMKSLPNPPLLADVDMDGQTDVIISTMDGIIQAYMSIHSGVKSRSETSGSSDWPFIAHGENFASSPTLVYFDEKGHSLIVVPSVGGVIYALDSHGAPSVKLQIPDLVLDVGEHQTGDFFIVAKHLRWYNSHGNETHQTGIRLVPRVYATPIVPVVTWHSSLSNPLDSDAIIIPVNFVPVNAAHGIDLILSALVSVSRRSFMSSHSWSKSDSMNQDFRFHVLEVGKLQNAKPPYLFATPVLVANPASHTFASTVPPFNNDGSLPGLFFYPTYKLLVSSFSGQLHVVPLPLRGITNPDLVNRLSRSFSSSSFAQSPVPVSCTEPGPIRQTAACCLLLDENSHLHLISFNLRNQLATSLVWTHIPRHQLDTFPHHKDQVGQVTVVQCGAGEQWAVYPTSNGFLHAVNISDGHAIPDYPLRLIGTNESMNVTFTMGPGILYSTTDTETWILLSDTVGKLYHVSMCRAPTVIQSVARSSDGFHTSSMWLMPTPLVSLAIADGAEPVSTKLQSLLFVLLSPDYVGILMPNKSVFQTLRFGSHGPRSSIHEQYPILASNQDLVYFIEPSSGDVLDHLRLERDQRDVHYRIHNCPMSGSHMLNSSDRIAMDIGFTVTDYVVQLVDAFGIQLSDWSIPIGHSRSDDTSVPLHPVCGGTLTISRPVYGSFRGRLFLLILDHRTGLIRAPGSTYQLATTTLLDVETLWPQLLTFWVYLPVLYLFLGLILLQTLPQWQTSSTAVRTEAISRLKFSHSV